jgi:hypothetical protein
MITAENITKSFKLYKSPADRLKEIVCKDFPFIGFSKLKPNVQVDRI